MVSAANTETLTITQDLALVPSNGFKITWEKMLWMPPNALTMEMLSKMAAETKKVVTMVTTETMVTMETTVMTVQTTVLNVAIPTMKILFVAVKTTTVMTDTTTVHTTVLIVTVQSEHGNLPWFHILALRFLLVRHKPCLPHMMYT